MTRAQAVCSVGSTTGLIPPAKHDLVVAMLQLAVTLKPERQHASIANQNETVIAACRHCRILDPCNLNRPFSILLVPVPKSSKPSNPNDSTRPSRSKTRLCPRLQT